MLTALVLSPFLFLVTASGVAQANPFPGTVTCSPAHGVWNGRVTFNPPLKFGGTANTETINVSATLGTALNPCLTTMVPPPRSMVRGKLAMHLIDISVPGAANDCATIFSGLALTPLSRHAAVIAHWTHPHGPKTKETRMSVTGTAAPVFTSITVSGGVLAGSFTPFATPSATLQDANWNAVVPAGCASAGGLHSLTLSTSTGTW